MVGDVIFYKKKGCPLSRLVNKISKDEFTHVGLIIAHDRITGVATIVEGKGFVETRISMMQINDSHDIYSTGFKTEDESLKIVRYSKSELGLKYSYFSVLKLFIKLFSNGEKHDIFNLRNKIICSVIGMSYYKAGIKRNNNLDIGQLTPRKLLDSYDLKLNRKSDITDMREELKDL